MRLRKDRIVSVRMTQEEFEHVEAMAQAFGTVPSAWMRQMASITFNQPADEIQELFRLNVEARLQAPPVLEPVEAGNHSWPKLMTKAAPSVVSWSDA